MSDSNVPALVLKSRAEQIIEARFGADVPTLLRELYHGPRRLSQAAIARELGVHRSTVVEWMQRYDIPRIYSRSEVA